MIKQSKRLDYIDSLRGLAALLVVFVHVGGDAVDTRHFVIHYLIDPGRIGVVWFFMISGMVIPYSLRSGDGALKRFIILRFFRLYPIYWVSLALFLAANLVYKGSIPSLRVILGNLTMFQTILGVPDIVYVYWTLFLELAFYIFCGVAFKFNRLKNIKFQEVSVIFFLGIALALGIARAFINLRFPVVLPLALALMTFGSIWRYATVERDPVAVRGAKRTLLAFAVLLPPIFIAAYTRDMGHGETWTRYLCTHVLAIGSFIFLTTKFRISFAPLVALGAVSYSFYLLHPTIIVIFDQYLPVGFVRAVTVIAVAISVSWIAYRAIESPFNALAKRIAGRVGARSALDGGTTAGEV